MKGILFLILTLGVVGVNAQTYDFGDIPKEHLEMEVYEKDSTASAVVLFSVGETELNYRNNEFHLRVKKHIRVKIVTDQGLSEGDISIPFRNDDSNSPQEIRNIKAESHTLNEDGEIIKESVGRRDRFEEEVSDRRSQIKFTIPGLKKGSIIEYEYEVYSNNPLDFPDWLFQDDIPVIWSEYTARIPEMFNFLTVTRGYDSFYVSDQKPYQGYFTLRNSNAGGLQRIEFIGTEYHYVMKDLRAIGNVPYMKASMDYLSHIRFQLQSIKFPNERPELYLGSWIGLINDILKDEDFGSRLRNSSFLTEAVSKATDGAESNLDKMVGIYNYVSEVMQWNDSYGLWAFDDLEKSVEEEILNIPIGSSMKVDSVWISKDKLDEAFEFSANFSNQHQSSSNIIYFNPMLVGGITENPFKLDERTFPIDYNYEFSESIVLNITIPDGWVIDEKPTPVLFKLPENMGEFRRIIQSSGNQISMNYVYKIKKMRFQSSEYEALKEMYDMMVEMLSQNLVLKKSI